jgi:hypothetical protein
LFHSRRKYNRALECSVGYASTSEKTNVNIVALSGNTPFVMTGETLVIEERAKLIQCGKISGKDYMNKVR